MAVVLRRLRLLDLDQSVCRRFCAGDGLALLKKELADKEKKLANREKLLAEKDELLSQKDAENARLAQKESENVRRLAQKDAELAKKDAAYKTQLAGWDAVHATQLAKALGREITSAPDVDTANYIRWSEMKIASSCFKRPYIRGDAPGLKSILESRLKHFSEEGYYSKYVALTNSSCMGKSRTVLELGCEQVFVCYCSLASPTASTFPPRTGALAALLAGSKTTAEMTFYLMAWLKVLVNFLEDPEIERGKDPAEVWVRMQESWHNSTTPKVMDVHARVVQTWMSLRHEFDGCFVSDDSSDETKLQELLAKSINDVLLRMGHQAEDDNRLKLLFVVDEVKGLLHEIVSEENKPGLRNVPFLHLRRAAQKLGPATLLLVVDTSTRVGQLAPAGEDDESRRARAAGVNLLHPVCCVSGLDLLKVPPPPTDVSRKAWLEHPVRWTKYGRLFWGLRMEQEGRIEHILQLAQLKLLNDGSAQPKMPLQYNLYVPNPDHLSELQAMALLAFTAGVEIAPNHHWAQELSASHMMAMALISEDRRRFWTVAPLEPVLSAAAAALLMKPGMLKKALQQFCRSLRVGVTSTPVGETTEMVLKICLTMAMLLCQDAALRRDGKYLSCIPSKDFLRLLVGESEDLGTLDGSFVFFNRILCVDHVPSRKEALEFLKRGVVCAGMAGNQNRGADVYVFLWFPKDKNPDGDPFGDETEISYLCLSAKTNSWQDWEKLTAKFLGIRVQNTLPYVSINYRFFPAGALEPPDHVPGRITFHLQGIPMPLADGMFKDCIPVLHEMMELDPIDSASVESRQSYRNVNPWSLKKFLNPVLKAAVDADSELFTL